MRRTTWLAGAALAVAVVVAGCTPADPVGPTGSTPTGSGSSSASSSSSPGGTGSSSSSAVEQAVEVSGKLAESEVTVTVHPVQVGEGWAALTLDWTVPKTSPSLYVSSYVSHGFDIQYIVDPRLVDLGASWVAWVGDDTAGDPVSTKGGLVAQPGQTVSGTVFFAVPPGETVDVLLPYLGLVEGVPVVPASASTPTPAGLGIAWDGDLPSASLESFTVAYDGSGSVGVDQGAATVTLASDVLFATDEFALTSTAQARVDEAAGAIKETADSGEVTVVGHTDDVDTEEHNQVLSEKRAASVADRLRVDLGSGFTVTAEGRGESDPAVAGTSAQARAANRRVEIGFTVDPSAGAIEVGQAAAPEAAGVSGAGHQEIEVSTREGTFGVKVARVQRREGYLVGTVEVTRTGDELYAKSVFLSADDLGPTWGRGLVGGALVASVRGLALLGQGSFVFPADYRTAPDGSEEGRQILGDMLVTSRFSKDGTPVLVTAIWPDTGQHTVSVDVDGLWRIADVPVEG